MRRCRWFGISPALRVSMVKLTQEIEALSDDAGSSGTMPLVSDVSLVKLARENECRASMSSGYSMVPPASLRSAQVV